MMKANRAGAVPELSSQSSLQTLSSQRKHVVKKGKSNRAGAVSQPTSEISSQSLLQTTTETSYQQIQNVSTVSQSVPSLTSFTDVDYENFEIYKRSFHKWAVVIKKNKNVLYESRCNCPAFGKEYICKHI